MMDGVLKLANIKNVPVAAGFRVFTAMRLNEETTAGLWEEFSFLL